MPRPMTSTLDPYAPEVVPPAIDDEPAVAADLPPGPGAEFVPADGEWKRATMRRFLNAQPKRAVAIPRDPGDKPGRTSFQRVIYQGFNYDVPKGRSVEVPEPIALILDDLEEGKLRTSQAKNRAGYLNDVGDGMGAEIHVNRGASA